MTNQQVVFVVQFLLRCTECRAVYSRERCLSVRLSNAWIKTKRKQNLCRFLYHTKHHL